GIVFEVRPDEAHVLKGLSYLKDGNKKNMVIMTGMQEHASRYALFAEHLNELGWDVHVLDAVGQGLNAPGVKDLQKWYPNAFDINVTAANKKVEELKASGSEKTVLFGHSMGSFMTARYLELFPKTTDGTIICGSNGPAVGLMRMGYSVARVRVTKKNWDRPSKFLSNLAMGGYAKAIKDRDSDLDWLSYNKENVKKYEADPYCGVMNTNGFWHEFLKTMAKLYTKKEWSKISSKEHILIISGEEDPVGNMGKGPRALEKALKKVGVEDVTLRMFEHMRHEILNEDKKEDVYKVVDEFLGKR
ncbi:MAG: alpha/beta hydrolase, partial [Bacilli bacterium]|nr:alpha/beta hydrolase [Bacilli bacterium]